MAIGKASDFKIYEDQMRGGVVETLNQATNYFNTAGGVIRLTTKSHRGQYAQESFFKNIASGVSRRDTTSVSAATDLALTMDEIISVKLKRKVGPYAQTLDAFRQVQMSATDQSLSFLLGTQVAKNMQTDMLNSAIRAGVASLKNQSDVYYDGTAGTMTASKLVSGNAKFGDAAQRIVTYVMHSKVYHDLVQNQIVPANNGEGAASATVYGGSPATLGRSIIVTDSDDLKVDDSPDLYYTLGLTPDALIVENSEEETMYSEMVTGLENLVVRLQGEFAYNLGVKGFKWDTANGGANPLDAAIATGSNWDKAVTSYKDLAGVCICTR
jgi:hypothetical protein